MTVGVFLWNTVYKQKSKPDINTHSLSFPGAVSLTDGVLVFPPNLIVILGI